VDLKYATTSVLTAAKNRSKTYSAAWLAKPALYVLVKYAGNEGLIRNTLSQGTLFQAAKILGQQPDVDPRSLPEQSLGIFHMLLLDLRRVFRTLELPSLERIQNFLFLLVQFTHRYLGIALLLSGSE
jgi:hypothetical protein